MGGGIIGKGGSRLINLIHNKPIRLVGLGQLNVKLIGNAKGINFITKSGARYEIGYHKFGVGDTMLHINSKGKHYYPKWGWPPFGVK